MRDNIFRDAWVTGANEEYRYTLTRVWGPGPLVLWVLANPSTADGKDDDQTAMKGMGFSRRWGFGGYVFANMAAHRATDPNQLIAAWKTGADVTGPQNDDVLKYLAYNLRFVVVAWGDCLKKYGVQRGPQVKKLLLDLGVQPLCLGRTAAGNPRHPLKLGYTTKLEAFT